MQEDLCTGMRVSSPALLLRESQENHAGEREWRKTLTGEATEISQEPFFLLLPPIRAACLLVVASAAVSHDVMTP